MNSLKIYRYKDFNTNQEAIVEIIYEDKTIATFDKEKNKIDLSVMNPFVGKVADIFTIDVNNKDMKFKEILIVRIEEHEILGTIIHFDDVPKNKNS